jgi:hypothetical protein
MICCEHFETTTYQVLIDVKYTFKNLLKHIFHMHGCANGGCVGRVAPGPPKSGGPVWSLQSLVFFLLRSLYFLVTNQNKDLELQIILF